jgi:hypothetical protein
VDSQGADWFWAFIVKGNPASSTRDFNVHRAFPNIRCIAERRSNNVRGSSVKAGGSEGASAGGIHVSISVRPHLNNDASTWKTMQKALAAILRFSETHHQTTINGYVEDITSLPTFTMRSAPDVSSITGEIFLERARKMAAETPSLSSLPPGQALGTMRRLYDAHESGQWNHLFPGAKQQFDFIMNMLAFGTETLEFHLDLDEIGKIPICLLLDKKAPNAQRDLFDVAYRLFLQMAVVFSTPMNLECYGPLTLELYFPSPVRMETWMNFVRKWLYRQLSH